MKAVIVQYKVRPEYVEQNKINIQNVANELLENPIQGMFYSAYNLEEDPQSFVHINICTDGETMSKINNVKSFQEFRNGLKASNPESPPRAMRLINIAAGFTI